MLALRDVSSGYGPLLAIRKLTIEVGRGEVVALLGANGAGKTTTLRTISGMLRAREGSIVYDDDAIESAKPDAIVRGGLVHVPEGRQVFATLTVRDNLRLGAITRGDRDGVGKDLERVHALFPVLADRGTQLSGSLSGGEQQMLAIGRALMCRPRFLMLDEPSLGLSPLYVERIFDAIDEINEQGTTILLVEQNARLALAASDRAYVLVGGEVALAGRSDDLAGDPRLDATYLGGDVERAALR
jgi:branched-chain amino acid transport system ATP-binding protein